uniref:Uncharacterized protein n=1 Tax=Gracilinema caldarium TaxID=215591 RepID=A0A7C3E1C0_9SPIR
MFSRKGRICSILVLLMLVCETAFSQNKILEGYAGIPWGSSIEQVKEKLTNLQEDKANDQIKNREKIYSQENEMFTRVLRFYDGKLYWGRTVYINPDNSTTLSIIQKIKDTYGTFDNSGKGSEPKYEYTWATKYYSKRLYVEMVINTYYNEYGRVSENSIFITYYDPVIQEQVQNELIKQKGNEIEL